MHSLVTASIWDLWEVAGSEMDELIAVKIENLAVQALFERKAHQQTAPRHNAPVTDIMQVMKDYTRS